MAAAMAQLVHLRPRPTVAKDGDPAAVTTEDRGTVYIETFGCQMNEADSALMAGQLRERGYQLVHQPEHADVILINTCAVREKAEDRVYGRTTQLLRHRQHRPNLVIGITGCMAEHLREQLAETAPHVTLVAGPDAYRRIADLVDRARTGDRVLDVELDRLETYEGLDPAADDDGVSGQITIQRGCDKFCTFCVVPFTRGRERGVAPREVLRHARTLAERGYKEVVLLGQTVNSYRYEDVEFADLLTAIAGIDGIDRVRFTSPYPVDFSDKLIAVMAHEQKVCPQVHLPLQSGSDRMLESMRRGYSRRDYLQLVDRLRRRIPGIAISTDIMVGFCGETQDDHQATLDIMREVQFDSAFMFRYSDRGITYAARRMQDDVAPQDKAQRLQDVIDLQDQYTRAAHDRRVGHAVDVLVVGPAKRGDRLLGRNPHFQKVFLPLSAGTPGQIVTARVVSSSGYSLVGEPLASPVLR